jgi:hypothetical protein
VSNNRLFTSLNKSDNDIENLRVDKYNLVKEVFDRGVDISYHKEIIAIRDNTINSLRKELDTFKEDYSNLDKINKELQVKINTVTKQVFLINTYNRRIEELKDNINKL